MPNPATGQIQGTPGPYEFNGAPVNGTNEIQTLTIGGTPTGGTFRLNFEGFVTGAITWSSTNNTLLSNINTALDALASLGVSGCVAAAGSLTSGIGTITLTFGANRGRQAIPSVIGVTLNALTGTSPTLAIVETTPGVDATARGAVPGAELVDSTNGNRYFNAGTALAPIWKRSAYDEQQQVATVTIPTASVLALNTTPFSLVAAQGAGTVVAVDEIAFKLIFNSVAYTGSNALEFRYTNGSGAKVTADIAAATLNASSGTTYNLVKGVTTALAPVANSPVVAFIPTANPGAGNSDVVITVTYRVLTP